MRVELWRAMREDVNALGSLLRTLESLHDLAVDGLEQMLDGDSEFLTALVVSISIRQAMDECVKFDAHFRKKYDAKEEEEK